MNNFDLYAWFKEKREQLATILTESSMVIKDLNMTNYSENLHRMGEKVNSDSFKIMVVGTFKNGKSTFINALLGEEVLPAFATPCTAVINEVKYAEEKGAVLHFRNPLPDFLLPFEDSKAGEETKEMAAEQRELIKKEHEEMREEIMSRIPDKARSHMEQNLLKDIPPLPIAYDEIEDYVVIPVDCEMEQALKESPYDKVELFYPLELLKNGVEIIDSPGLNEAECRTKVTMEYLSKADAIIMLLDAIHICSQEEMRFIEKILTPAGFNEPFFVVNRWDMIRENQRSGFKRYEKLLNKYTTQKVHFLSSLNGMEAKIEKDEEKYEASGTKEFENALMVFLANERGRVKLAQPAKELNRILNDEALFKIIPSQRAMLATSLSELEERYDNAKPQLDTLKLRKEQMLSDMRLKIERCRSEFKRAAEQNALDIIAKVPFWVGQSQPKSEIGVFTVRKDIEPYTQEIIAFVQEKIEEEQNLWRTDVLEPLIKEKADIITENLKEDIEDLYKSIDQVHYSISGGSMPAGKDVPAWERMVGAIGGFVFAGGGGAYSGSISGLSKELAQTIAFNVGGFLLLSLLGWLTPVTMIALLIGTIIFGHIAGKKQIENSIRNQISDHITNQLANTQTDTAYTIADNIVENMNGVVKQVGTAVDMEIANVEEQIQTMLNEMNEGQERIDARKAVINNCEEQLQKLTGDLSQLTFELMAGKTKPNEA